MALIDTIPQKWRKLNQSQAAKLASENRSTFIRNYLKTGKIRPSKDEEGNEFISFNALYEEFGEQVLEKLRLLEGEQDDTVQSEQKTVITNNSKHTQIVQKPQFEHLTTLERVHELELELARTKGEKATLEKEVELIRVEKDARIEDLTTQLNWQKTQIERSQLLLEDKTSKADSLADQLKQQSEALTVEQNKSWWQKLIGR